MWPKGEGPKVTDHLEGLAILTVPRYPPGSDMKRQGALVGYLAVTPPCHGDEARGLVSTATLACPVFMAR